MNHRGILILALACWVAAGTGCVSYTSQAAGAQTEVLSEGPKTREVSAVLHGHVLRVGARATWTQELRRTVEHEGSYEFESFLGSDAETWWFYLCVSPVILPIDLVQFALSSPFALIEHATDFDETYDHNRLASEPLVDLPIQVTSPAWTTQATTTSEGEAQIDLSPGALLALQAGKLLSYQWQAEGEEARTQALDLDETLLAARGQCGPTPPERHAFWLALKAKAPPGEVRAALTARARWISPATLERYRLAQGLHAQLTLSEVAAWREHAKALSLAGAANNLAASNALSALAQIALRVDRAEADRLALRSVRRGAEYVAKDYYAESPVLVYPHPSLVVFCEARLPLARRLGDPAATAVFSTLVALRSNWDSVQRVSPGEHAEWVVAFTNRAADAVVARRAQEAAAKEEAARRAAQAKAEAERQAREDAFHYRYLTGAGVSSRGSGSAGASPSRSTYSSPSRAPRASEYQRMQSWRRNYEWRQDQANRAFNQHR